jgi:hypothetical protein
MQLGNNGLTNKDVYVVNFRILALEIFACQQAMPGMCAQQRQFHDVFLRENKAFGFVGSEISLQQRLFLKICLMMSLFTHLVITANCLYNRRRQHGSSDTE